ncbi:Hsp20/alpha crystallin family protein [Flavobacterium psychrotrophum]|uniref:Hsp20/alpha crystallin family protein n=1 Tax=Flavobacterium psychrotrophum TaxID=2294119 RepID=UPI000E3195C6|nr:Hsp20/alpha crystallin family protein [Flavobacterium psychrotrophum]
MNLLKRNGSQLQGFPRLFFDDIFGRELFNWENNNFSSTSTTLPSVNIKETSESYQVEVAAPGMEKSDFNVTLDGNLLIISSARELKETTQQETFTHREFSYQSFQRSFELPKNVVDEQHITARYENGVLLLTVPKKEEAKQKPFRMIKIS